MSHAHCPLCTTWTRGAVNCLGTRARSSTDRASDYGSEGWGFESLRARPAHRPFRLSAAALLLTDLLTTGPFNGRDQGGSAALRRARHRSRWAAALGGRPTTAGRACRHRSTDRMCSPAALSSHPAMNRLPGQSEPRKRPARPGRQWDQMRRLTIPQLPAPTRRSAPW